VIDIDEVFVAKIACSGVISASFSKIIFLRLKSSVAASTTKSTLLRPYKVSPKVTLDKT
jgi:hypothetical protein